ncbi:hypothetical protein QYE76_033165 [Lolium multiflorum]|uniref:CCHC-type domain-containing protein n=1 Tax=Lolium multiflorum TaxID=4521 RepID=A0AAD8QX03_LOLMU|nr:hypothetical protein QYE76_033165 [Lolium multiflorum]
MSSGDAKIVNQKNKDGADVMTWREYEALRNEMRREFGEQGQKLNDDIEKVTKTLDTTNETVNTIQVQVTDIQRSIQALQIAVENLTQQQQQQHEDGDSVHGDFEEQPAAGSNAAGRGVGRGNRGRGFVELGSRRSYNLNTMVWLWRLHEYTEDRKIKLASSEFDGYVLRWWDGVTRTRQENGEVLVLIWHEMKAIMQEHFVATNYLRSIFDKLNLLNQGVLMVDAYFMEMKMLMQRGRVRESLHMTMQRFLHGLKYNIKGIVRHHTYNNRNQLLHHAREPEAQLAEEAQIKGRATGAGRYTPREPPSMAPELSSRSAPFPTSSSKPVQCVKHKEARTCCMNCHTCGGKGHFKRDCPNCEVIFINDNHEYETGNDADPDAPEDDDYDSDGVHAFPSEARTIIVSQRALNVQLSASTQRCNLFQIKALVDSDSLQGHY